MITENNQTYLLPNKMGLHLVGEKIFAHLDLLYFTQKSLLLKEKLH